MGAFGRTVTILLASGLLAAADDWPQFRGNLQLTGVATGAVPANLKLLWTYDAGEAIQSSAAIAGGTVYVGVESGDLLALDAASGKLRWKYRAKDAIGESSPAVHDGVVYVGDLAGVLHAVNAADGKRLWSYTTEGEIKSSPVVAGDRVLVGSYDGKLLWKFETSNYVHATPVVSSGGLVYLSGCDEVFHGVRLADGQEVFQFPSGGYTAASVALLGEWAYYGNFSNEVLGVNLRLKRIAWHYETGNYPFYSSAAATGDRIVLGGRDKLVHCVNAKTGKALWTFATRARIDSSPAIASGRVYVGSNDGHFYVLDLASGKKLWDFEAGTALSASPAIAGGRVVIGAQDGRLYCFGGTAP